MYNHYTLNILTMLIILLLTILKLLPGAETIGKLCTKSEFPLNLVFPNDPLQLLKSVAIF